MTWDSLQITAASILKSLVKANRLTDLDMVGWLQPIYCRFDKVNGHGCEAAFLRDLCNLFNAGDAVDCWEGDAWWSAFISQTHADRVFVFFPREHRTSAHDLQSSTMCVCRAYFCLHCHREPDHCADHGLHASKPASALLSSALLSASCGRHTEYYPDLGCCSVQCWLWRICCACR